MSKASATPTSAIPDPPSSRITGKRAGSRVRINADIREELHRTLKAHAALRGLTVVDMIEEWVAQLPPLIR